MDLDDEIERDLDAAPGARPDHLLPLPLELLLAATWLLMVAIAVIGGTR